MSLVELLLDGDILDKFPTCNLDRLKENSGKLGKEKELSRLLALNECRTGHNPTGNIQHNKTRYIGQEVWEYCSNLAAVLATNHDNRGRGKHGEQMHRTTQHDIG